MASDSEVFEGAPRRTRLPGTGDQPWRSLEELEGSAELAELIEREFPEQAAAWSSEVGRRSFLKLMAASLGLAGLTSCNREPPRAIVPYVDPPEQVLPGKPLYFATAMPLRGYAQGLLVESHMGRPTKVEGNPDHPASLGASGVEAQASVLTFWDPDRAQAVTRAGRISTWGSFLEAWRRETSALEARGGRGLRILTGAITSPMLLERIGALLRRFPESRWHHYDPAAASGPREGARLAFGRPADTIYRFERAARVLSLDADFLNSGPAAIRQARDFIDRRRVRSPMDREGRRSGIAGHLTMNRLYMVQSTPTITGAMADHRLVAPAARVERLARTIAARLGVKGVQVVDIEPNELAWIERAAEDLEEHRGASIVIAGEHQPAAVHALAHAINEALGSHGSTVLHIDPVAPHPLAALDSLTELVREMNAGEVEVLLILGQNPVFTAPADLGFTAALERVRLRAHHGLYYDETSFHCHWHLPEAHYLESWGDARAFDGTASIIQPLIAPLYRGRGASELLAALAGDEGLGELESLRRYWRSRHGAEDFEPFWREALRRGVVPETASAPLELSVAAELAEKLPPPPEASAAPGGFEVIFRPEPFTGDGTFANNAWLQELPRPLTKLTWDNPALIAPSTARELKIASGEVARLSLGGRELEIPVWILPGHPERAVTLHFGPGRARSGRVGTGAGFDTYPLRTSQAMWFAGGLELRPLGRRHPLASTQAHQMMRGPTRELIQVRTLEEFVRELERGPPPKHHEEHRFSLYPEFDYTRGHQWAMQIDNNACIGCQACVVACQAENNIPVVGKEEVLNSREMHWLRIDTYFDGDPARPETYFEPIPCMHCEKAPCEPVCPVAATTHSAEGLNEMTYNRCVGTRYCSNNCPYRVRRFNFYEYAEFESEASRLRANPDVTLRPRGVMEKCTYCVQRLNRTRIELKTLEVQSGAPRNDEERRALVQRRDALMSALEPACAQACPTAAIIFGDLNWKFTTPEGELRPSPVAELRRQPQDFGLLTKLNTQPRTRYLPRFRNPNPALESGRQERPEEQGAR
jgi:MoCo/4Fe-4S cofactor protein with predicted Tat translocation signal